jgi:hypothetical protein
MFDSLSSSFLEIFTFSGENCYVYAKQEEFEADFYNILKAKLHLLKKCVCFICWHEKPVKTASDILSLTLLRVKDALF